MEKHKTVIEKVKDVEDFFTLAFCAKSARIIKGGNDDFNILSVIKVETDDDRGMFCVAFVEKKTKEDN